MLNTGCRNVGKSFSQIGREIFVNVETSVKPTFELIAAEPKSQRQS